MILKTVFSKLFMIREQASRSRPGADEGYDPMEKPFLDHLEDLRTTLIQMCVTLAIVTVLCFSFHIQIFKFLQMPAKITKMDDGGTLWDKIEFIVLAPQEILMLMMKVSFFTAVVISMPLLIYFAFGFILPGLRQIEKRMVIPGALVGFFLFLIGASFAFFLAAPIALKFFFVFQNERIGDLNPAAKALESPIAEMQLLGVGGRRIMPIGEEEVTAEVEKDPGAPPNPTPKVSVKEVVPEAVKGSGVSPDPTQKDSEQEVRTEDEKDASVSLDPTPKGSEQEVRPEDQKDGGVSLDPGQKGREQEVRPEDQKDPGVSLDPSQKGSEQEVRPEDQKDPSVSLDPSQKGSEKEVALEAEKDSGVPLDPSQKVSGNEVVPGAKKGSSELLDPIQKSTEHLSPEMKSAVRGYMIDLLAVQQGTNFVLRYDESRDKIILAYAKGAKATYQIGKYFEFVTRLTLVFGLSFQLPVVVTILVKLELLTARVMRSTRTYAWIVILVAAAILTPPDVMTLGLLGGPMILLYEICVIIATVIEKKREIQQRSEEKKRRSRMERLYSKSSDDLTEEEKAELQKHEIQKYEKEHANLLPEGGDGHKYDEHGHLIGYDPDHPADDDTVHDESWHEDHHYWHDGMEEADEPVDAGDIEEPNKVEGEAAPVQDWPDRDSEPSAESDHAEPTGDIDDKSESKLEEGSETESAEETGSEEKKSSISQDIENCEPSGPVVDMNYATAEELMDLPGVDEWLANMIIDHRPYESFEDLEEIVGDDRVMQWMERLMLG